MLMGSVSVCMLKCAMLQGDVYIEVSCCREARQAMETASRREELMQSLINLEEEQRRQTVSADSAVRTEKVCHLLQVVLNQTCPVVSLYSMSKLTVFEVCIMNVQCVIIVWSVR